MNPFRNIRAALFDLDGTLIETHIDFPGMKCEMLTMARSYGLDSTGLESLDILTVVEESRRRLIRSGRAESGDRLRMEAFARLEDIEADQCRNPVEIPGASHLLREIVARGVRVGIVTRNCRRVALELTRIGQLSYDSLVTRDDVALTKPDPGHLTATLRELGFSRAFRQGVMVGDHWMDVQAGRAAGLATVGILHGKDESFFAPAPPDLTVDKLVDLLPLVA